jgi:ribosome-associated protein
METGVIEIKIREEDEFIKLGQALKKAGLADSGVEAKEAILDGLVKVNGDVATQRGKKLYGGEIITYNGETVKVEK